MLAGHHSVTQGFGVGEVVRRVTGQSGSGGYHRALAIVMAACESAAARQRGR